MYVKMTQFRDYQLNKIRIDKACDYDAGQTAREFSASLHFSPPLDPVKVISLTLNCTASTDAFAFLEKEGKTFIHTTTMGDCSARVKAVGYDKV